MTQRTPPTGAEYGQFLFQAQRLAWMTQRRMDQKLRAELGISQMQFMILSVVDVQPGEINQRTVADFLGTTSATVSRHLDIASQSGYLTVQVSPTSRRENTVALTDLGRDLLARADAIVEAEAQQVLSKISADDFSTAARVVTSMLGSSNPTTWN